MTDPARLVPPAERPSRRVEEAAPGFDLPRRLAAEGVGTALLLAAVVGSGIMGERLAGGSVGLALLANTIATGAALVALILTFGPISGAHFNPAVTLCAAASSGLPWREVPSYVMVQVGGALGGVAAANLMFGLPAFFASQKVRAGGAQLFAESVATFGLLAVIGGVARLRPDGVAVAVGCYITAAVLVHRLDLVCESGRHAGPVGERHLRGHSTRRCAGLHRRAARGRRGRHRAVPLAPRVAAPRALAIANQGFMSGPQ